MYCTHCGYDLNEKKQKVAALQATNFRTAHTKLTYVCPRCGHIIKEDLSEEDIKALSRASHAEIHRARNSRNTGMCFLVLGGILLVISFLFFLMSFKAAMGGKLSVGSTEFKVFIALLALGVAGCGFGAYSLISGIKKNHKYSTLLRDINNNVFNQ